MVVGLGVVHSLRVLPGEVADKTNRWQDEAKRIEHRRSEDDWNDAIELGREATADGWCSIRICREEYEPNNKGSWVGNGFYHSILAYIFSTYFFVDDGIMSDGKTSKAWVIAQAQPLLHLFQR